MTDEDEEFNRIEREAKQRMEAVSAAVAQEPVQWGVDWGRAGQAPCVTIIKRLPNCRIEVLAVEYGPERTWRGLTDDEMYKLWLTVDEEADRMAFGKAVENKLKEKNEM